MKTNRLRLELFTKRDVDLFHQINTTPFVRKHLWDDEIIPLTLATEIVTESENRFQNEKWGLWKIILPGSEKCIGYVGFWYFFDEKQPQLLYALLKEYTGNGYATEAATKMIAYAFDALQFEYVSATMDYGNIKSTVVCENLGMELVDEQVMEGKPTLFYQKLK